MRYLSLFSGIEAASLAWCPLGWTPAAFAEIEPFACAVLKHHYPDVPNLGDVTKITEAQVRALGRIDVVVGGFPCQDVSVAGKRAGLERNGEPTRSGLFWEAIRALRACAARWAVIENVPGLLTSHGGRDFGVVVGALAGCEFDIPALGWPSGGVAAGPHGLVEWRVLDAQFFGLPQRRPRVFLVLDSGDRAGRAPVLLEPEGLRRGPDPRRPVQDEDADGAADGPDAGGGDGVPAADDDRPIAFGPQEGRNFRASVHTFSAVTASQKLAVLQDGVLRWLTPVECARLQGFPDRYLDIEFKGRPASDAKKYRALGNSMAVPVMRWIGERIQAACGVAP